MCLGGIHSFICCSNKTKVTEVDFVQKAFFKLNSKQASLSCGSQSFVTFSNTGKNLFPNKHRVSSVSSGKY